MLMVVVVVKVTVVVELVQDPQSKGHLTRNSSPKTSELLHLSSGIKPQSAGSSSPLQTAVVVVVVVDVVMVLEVPVVVVVVLEVADVVVVSVAVLVVVVLLVAVLVVVVVVVDETVTVVVVVVFTQLLHMTGHFNRNSGPAMLLSHRLTSSASMAHDGASRLPLHRNSGDTNTKAWAATMEIAVRSDRTNEECGAEVIALAVLEALRILTPSTKETTNF